MPYAEASILKVLATELYRRITDTFLAGGNELQRTIIAVEGAGIARRLANVNAGGRHAEV